MTPLLDRLVVKFRAWDEPRVAAIVAQLGGHLKQRLAPIRRAVIEVDAALASELFLAYERHPDVEDVDFDLLLEPNALYHDASNDALLPFQYALHRMNVLSAWKHSRGAGIVCSVVDNGVDLNGMPEYAGKTIYHWNSHHNGATAPDPYYEGDPPIPTIDVTHAVPTTTPMKHGCLVFSIIGAGGAGDGVGPLGVAPDCAMLNMAVYDGYSPQAGSGYAQADMVAGVLASVAAPFHAKVINISVGLGSGAKPLPANSIWIDTFESVKDVALCFVSAGNDARDLTTGWQSPASFAPGHGGFCVGCSDASTEDRPANYSNYGTDVNAVAPGHGAWSVFGYDFTTEHFHYPADWVQARPQFTNIGISNARAAYRQTDGTSSATPLVAGVAALVWALNPSWPASTVRQILLDSQDRPAPGPFTAAFPNAGVINALKAVLRGRALLAPGSVFPYVGFMGPGVSTEVAAGVATKHLRGPMRVEVDGMSTNPITNVKLYAGTTLIYDGPPKRNADCLLVHAHALAVGDIRVVASTASASSDETYTDIVAHAAPSGAMSPPRTSAVPAEGVVVPGSPITLTAESDAHPVRISYRWGSGAWQRYAAPIPAQTGSLQFYGVDALGNVEGGVDYDPDV